MGRLAWYAGASTALAAGVVISAFNQRVNFYSACVYLAQSNLCLMILINLILFIYGSFMYGLQRLCFGALRPIEIEQLYEKAWFAITETCLAMTIFREEVGAWFLVMFVALLTGKVWGWIGDGRVEVLEQQPPANPRLFHIRLSISLAASILYDMWLMSYTINTVIQQARPNMMVMFLFEFAILTSSSFSTAVRYIISLVEAKIVKKQTQDRLLERRRQVREERVEMVRQREAATATAAAEGNEAPTFNEPLQTEDDLEEMDIEVPGWEAKGQWVLSLDLCSDFVKLCIYLTFFIILLMFYGLPIHIIRDLFMTTRSFVKRLTAFVRYRRATQDMNARYEDATVEDIQREDTCIICREEMRPWSVTNPPAPAAVPGAPPPPRPVATANERSRPKKLPCGHTLHLGCLKSWLERQQVCPTCRRSVTDPVPTVPGAGNNANAAAARGAPPAHGQPNANGAAPPPAGRPAGGRGMRMLNFGPIRVGFGQANLQDMAQGLGPQLPDNGAGAGARVYGLELGFPRRPQPQPQVSGSTRPDSAIQEQLRDIEQEITSEIQSLQVTQQELQLVQLLQIELSRLRLMQNGGADPLAPPGAGAAGMMPQMPRMFQPPAMFPNMIPPPPQPQMQRHGARPNISAIPSGSAELPPGVVIPEGWSLLPLERLDDPAGPSFSAVTQTETVPASGPTAAPTATTNSNLANLPGDTFNRTLTPTPTSNPEAQSHPSSTDSSDAIHTPPSISADQSGAWTSTVQNTTVPSTTTLDGTTLPNADPSVLPNWGASQFFAGPRGRSTSSSNDVLIDRPNRNSEDEVARSPEDQNFFRANRERAWSNQATEGSSQGALEAAENQDKGKARAVSMEDVEDEAEGT